MKSILAIGLVLLAAACSPAPEPEAATSEPAAPAIEAAAPAPAAAAAELAVPAQLTGRWGHTAEACAPANASKDGVIEITASTVVMGLDACTIVSTRPEGAGALMLLQCKGGDGGGDYERDAQFISSTPETMTWVTEGGAAEPYVRCQ